MLPPQDVENVLDFLAQRGEVCFARRGGAADLGRLGHDFVEPVARATDGEALVVEQIADPTDQQNLVVLVITPVAAPFDGLTALTVGGVVSGADDVVKDDVKLADMTLPATSITPAVTVTA